MTFQNALLGVSTDHITGPDCALYVYSKHQFLERNRPEIAPYPANRHAQAIPELLAQYLFLQESALHDTRDFRRPPKNQMQVIARQTERFLIAFRPGPEMLN